MYRVIVLAPACAVLMWFSWCLAGELDGIRGPAPLNAVPAAPPLPALGADRVRPRSFPEQPPTTPHPIDDDYKFGLAENRCLLCHGPSATRDLTHAPKVSASHLVRRDGNAGSEVTAGHRFCLTCHVVQTDAGPPIANTYRAAGEGSR